MPAVLVLLLLFCRLLFFATKLWNTKTIKENQTKTDEVEYVNADSNTIAKKNDILFQWQHTNYTNLQNRGGGCGGGVDYLFRGWWRCRRCQSSNTHTSINANAFPTNVGKMDTQRLEKSIDSRHPQLITNYTEHSHCWHSCRTTIEANMWGEKKITSTNQPTWKRSKFCYTNN